MGRDTFFAASNTALLYEDFQNRSCSHLESGLSNLATSSEHEGDTDVKAMFAPLSKNQLKKIKKKVYVNTTLYLLS